MLAFDMKLQGSFISMHFLTGLLFLSPPAEAFCGAYVGETGSKLINNSSEVILARENNVTTLTLAMDYQGDATEFALVLPVPEALYASDVKVMDQEVFDWIDGYSAPRAVDYSCNSVYAQQVGGCGNLLACSPGDYGSAKESWGVTVEDAFTEGGYDFVSLSADGAEGLMTWLDANGYSVPSGGEKILQEYIDGGASGCENLSKCWEIFQSGWLRFSLATPPTFSRSPSELAPSRQKALRKSLSMCWPIWRLEMWQLPTIQKFPWKPSVCGATAIPTRWRTGIAAM
jgi:hypothetical protein